MDTNEWMRLAAASATSGAAAGAYLLGSLLRQLGDAQDRPAARAALGLSLPLALGAAAVMGLESVTGPVLRVAGGSLPARWGLFLVFLGFSLAARAEARWLASGERGRAGRTGWRRRLGQVVLMAGCVPAILVGADPNGLAAGPPAAGWEDPTWIRALFLASGAAMGLAAMRLVIARQGSDRPVAVSELRTWLDAWLTLLQLIVLVVWVASLRSLARPALTTWPGALIPALVVPLGLVVPLACYGSSARRRPGWLPWLVIAGGFLLRLAVLGLPQALLESEALMQPGA